jgi:allantoicase
LGGKIIAFSDEFFASASNLINPLPPIRRPNTFTENGAWFDGWETRRHNDSPEGDWVIIRLGVGSGIAMGVEVDTAFFNGNHAPEVTVQGTFAPEAAGIPDAKVSLLFSCQLALIVVGGNSSETRMWSISETFMAVT